MKSAFGVIREKLTPNNSRPSSPVNEIASVDTNKLAGEPSKGRCINFNDRLAEVEVEVLDNEMQSHENDVTNVSDDDANEVINESDDDANEGTNERNDDDEPEVVEVDETVIEALEELYEGVVTEKKW